MKHRGVLPVNSLPQPNKSGGWILRYIKGDDGEYVLRNKVNFPTDWELRLKISDIISVTAPKELKVNMVDLYDARLDITTANGDDVLCSISCTKNQSTLFI